MGNSSPITGIYKQKGHLYLFHCFTYGISRILIIIMSSSSSFILTQKSLRLWYSYLQVLIKVITK